MWGKIIIPMYRLWLNGLYGLYGPRCPLFSKRPINLISLSLSLSPSLSPSLPLSLSTWTRAAHPWHPPGPSTGPCLIYDFVKRRNGGRQRNQPSLTWAYLCWTGSRSVLGSIPLVCDRAAAFCAARPPEVLFTSVATLRRLATKL